MLGIGREQVRPWNNTGGSGELKEVGVCALMLFVEHSAYGWRVLDHGASISITVPVPSASWWKDLKNLYSIQILWPKLRYEWRVHLRVLGCSLKW